MPDKQFHLQADEIRPLVQDHGGCFATDMITVHGHKVGFMYREEPEFDVDSGWRFLTGTESQDYLDDPTNFAIYAVNTIANYDTERSFPICTLRSARHSSEREELVTSSK